MLCYYRIKVQMIGERKRERKEKWTEWMVNEWEGRIRQAPGRRNNRCQLTQNFLPTQTLWIYQINDVSWNVKARWTQCFATLTVNNKNPEKIFLKNSLKHIYNISLQLRVFKVQSQLKKAEAL